jgi:hypothetical protein
MPPYGWQHRSAPYTSIRPPQLDRITTYALERIFPLEIYPKKQQAGNPTFQANFAYISRVQDDKKQGRIFVYAVRLNRTKRKKLALIPNLRYIYYITPPRNGRLGSVLSLMAVS